MDYWYLALPAVGRIPLLFLLWNWSEFLNKIIALFFVLAEFAWCLYMCLVMTKPLYHLFVARTRSCKELDLSSWVAIGCAVFTMPAHFFLAACFAVPWLLNRVVNSSVKEVMGNFMIGVWASDMLVFEILWLQHVNREF